MKFNPIITGLIVAAVAFVGTAPVALNLYSNQVKTAANKNASAPSPSATPIVCDATPQDIAQLSTTLTAMDQDIQVFQNQHGAADQIKNIQQAKVSLEETIKHCNYKL